MIGMPVFKKIRLDLEILELNVDIKYLAVKLYVSKYFQSLRVDLSVHNRRILKPSRMLS